jgi:hypothetical protein
MADQSRHDFRTSSTARVRDLPETKSSLFTLVHESHWNVAIKTELIQGVRKKRFKKASRLCAIESRVLRKPVLSGKIRDCQMITVSSSLSSTYMIDIVDE